MERGKGYLRSIFLEKEGVAWFLSTLGEAMKEEENVKFIRKFRDSHKAFLGLRSSNTHGSYLAFEEYSGRGATLLSLRIRTNEVVEVLWRFYNFYWLPIPQKKKKNPRGRGRQLVFIGASRSTWFLNLCASG